jgi:hypothetical protein
MSLVPMLMKKDFICAKKLICYWMIFFLLGAVNALLSFRYVDNFFPVFFRIVTEILLIPAVIQADATVGSTAFCLTRPISRKELLLSKFLLLAGLIVLLPMAGEILIMTHHGVPLSHALLAVPEIAIEKMNFLVLISIPAVLTQDFKGWWQLSISMCILGGILLLVGTFVLAATVGGAKTDIPIWSSSLSLQLSTETAGNVFIILWGSGAIVLQYLLRRTKVTVVWIVLGFSMLCTLWVVWPWDFLRSSETSFTDKQKSISAFLDRGSIKVTEVKPDWAKEISRKELSAEIETPELKTSELAVGLNNWSSEINFDDSTDLFSSYILDINAKIERINFLSSLKAHLKGYDLIGVPQSTNEDIIIFRIDPAGYESNKGKKGTYSASLDFELFGYKTAWILPLAQGAHSQSNRGEILLREIKRTPTALTVTLFQKETNLLLGGAVETEEARQGLMSYYRAIYVLSNPKLKEAYLVTEQGSIFSAESESITPADIEDSWPERRFPQGAFSLTFDVSPENQKNPPTIDGAWLKDAQLTKIVPVKTGSVLINIHEEDFILPVQ